MKLLGDPLAQMLVFLFGSIAIYRIVRRNRVREGKVPRARARARRLAPGYRGLTWGEAPRPEMVLYHDGLVEKLYRRRGETMRLGDAPLSSVLYSYHLGRLQAVMIEMPRRAATDALVALVAEWGEARSLGEAGSKKRFWKDLGTGRDAMQAVFDEGPDSPVAALVVSSKAVERERVLEDRPTIRVRAPEDVRLAAAMEASR